MNYSTYNVVIKVHCSKFTVLPLLFFFDDEENLAREIRAMHIFEHGLNQHFDAVLPVLFALYTKESLTIFSFSIELEHHRMGVIGKVVRK